MESNGKIESLFHKKHRASKFLSRGEDCVRTFMGRLLVAWCGGETSTSLRGGNDKRLWEETSVAVALAEFAKGLV